MSVEQENSSKKGSLVKLIEILKEVDTSSPTAKINEKSITDNNGGRIIL
jgi:hypothetical protein